MKKLIVLICFFAVNNGVFAQVNIPNFIRYWADEAYFFVGYNNQLFECVTHEKIYRNITDLCYIDNYGYLRINYKRAETSYFINKEVLHYLILSPRQLFVFMSNERIGISDPNIGENPWDARFADIFIENIKSNVFLRENNSYYSSQNFLRRFYRTDMGFPYDYWSKALPLAVTNEQMNLFEMEIKFKYDVSGILLLNGFVDFFRPHLYMDNRRVRELKIIDKKNKFEINYVLEDKIEFQEIIFPSLSNNVIIKILSYYNGNRYTDICLSSIIPIYNSTMFREARLWPEQNYNNFIKEMIETYREVK